MGLQIESGTGNAKLAKVDDYNRLLTLAVAATPEHFANHDLGRAWYMSFSQTTAASTDQCFFYIKNLSADYELVINGFAISVDKATAIYTKIGMTGTPGGTPTAITPVNGNTGSGLSVNATVYKDDSMTGLSGGGEINRKVFIAAAGTTEVNFESDVILAQGGTLTLWAAIASVATICRVDMFNGTRS